MRIAFLVTDNREGYRKYEDPAPWFGTAPQGLLEGFALLKDQDFEIHVVSCCQKPVAAPEKIAENIWFHSLTVPKAGWLRTGYLGCILAVRRKLKEIKPDLVHAQGTERDCAISAVFSPYPRVLTIHGNLQLIVRLMKIKSRSALGIQSRLEAFCIPRFQGVVCITRYTEKHVKTQNPKTWLLPNAATGSFFEVQSSPAEPMEILYIATVDERKNQNAFIDAIAPLALKYHFKVRFFGLGHEGSEFMRAFQERIERYSWCTYEGVIAHADLRHYFARASILVLASLEDNCPMTVLEAMASGVPVMASSVGGIPDLIQNEVNGLLCDPLSQDSMRDTLERLIANPQARKDFAATARRQTLDRNHPRIIGQKHLEIYREVIGKVG